MNILFYRYNSICEPDMIEVLGRYSNSIDEITIEMDDKNISSKECLCALSSALQQKKYDFVFLHIKPTDSLAEDGNYIGKRDFIEKMDKYVSILNEVDDETLIVITADHSTACELKAHSADPVPILFHAKGIRNDNLAKFGERECSKGSLGVIEGKDVMPNVLNIMGKLPLIGA